MYCHLVQINKINTYINTRFGSGLQKIPLRSHTCIPLRYLCKSGQSRSRAMLCNNQTLQHTGNGVVSRLFPFLVYIIVIGLAQQVHCNGCSTRFDEMQSRK